ncbi:hypothetical protein D051_4157 [Vibrio parahaemolyticus VPCR-2010]|uniref:hypothetical protein n=1 Tax=Vibrio parahaemolyticus TaxID=670 RepID=UPI00038E7316|nr:hypothetical protein [Vibrio parahaemolyticus]EQM51491.1 hypothetical protein D051_4157 [Vibrio parahaemolyticus VPCR-2010]
MRISVIAIARFRCFSIAANVVWGAALFSQNLIPVKTTFKVLTREAKQALD